jgi:hypothetical protein
MSIFSPYWSVKKIDMAGASERLYFVAWRRQN